MRRSNVKDELDRHFAGGKDNEINQP